MSNLGEPRVPKPNQGGQRGGTPKAPLKGGNSQGTGGGSFKKGTHVKGVGGSGVRRNPPRT